MMGGVWALFDRAEKVAKPQVKERISAWLLTAQVPAKDNWPATFEALADNLYGKDLLSVQSVLVSVLLSVLSVVMLSPLWYFLWPEDVDTYLQGESVGFLIFLMLLFGIMFNGVQDYLSVIQTRYLLRRLGHNATFLKQLTILLLDFVLTSALIWITLVIYFTFVFIGDEFYSPLETFIQSLKFRPASSTAI